jgi:hypothetical protein
MSARTLTASLLVVAGALGIVPSAGATPPREVSITGTRIHIGDLALEADAAAALVDLGPSPAAGVSHLVTRADITAALDAKQIASRPLLPDAIRVVRRAKHLVASEVNAIVHDALGSKDLGRGVTLASVHADRPWDVADGWTRVVVDVPRAPKKVGTFSTTAIASLFAGDEVIARLLVPVDLTVAAEGATFDAVRGSAIILIVRRSFIEVRALGTAGTDADVGDPIPVQLRPSGRVVRARLISRDEAIADGASPAPAGARSKPDDGASPAPAGHGPTSERDR